MENEEEILEEENAGQQIRMSNFSMLIAIVFVTLVMIALFIKIVFD